MFSIDGQIAFYVILFRCQLSLGRKRFLVLAFIQNPTHFGQPYNGEKALAAWVESRWTPVVLAPYTAEQQYVQLFQKHPAPSPVDLLRSAGPLTAPCTGYAKAKAKSLFKDT